MVQIIPSVLATSQEQYQRDIFKLNASQSLKEGWVHIDFADNIFVQNQTIELEIIKKFPINFCKEAHLMVSKPKDWIDDLIKTDFERVIIHAEAEVVEECIDYAKSKGLDVGIAIKNETNIDVLEPFIDKISTVLVMSIIPGFQNQPFLPESLKKIAEIKSKGWNVRIGLDGGIKDNNIKEIVDSGVNFVIVGSYLLKGNVDENLEILWEIINV